MKFPQYLWRVGSLGLPLVLRRGNDINEPVEKCLRNDDPQFIIGVMDHCMIGDATRYSSKHPWNWFDGGR